MVYYSLTDDVTTVSVRHVAVLTTQSTHVHIYTYGSFSLSERERERDKSSYGFTVYIVSVTNFPLDFQRNIFQ